MPKGAPDVERCAWSISDPIYIDYHDKEWGVPVWEDRALFEKLILDGFQAGLSWLIVLKKREHMREVFGGFDPYLLARFDPKQIERLLVDPGIIRNRAKVDAAVHNARAYLTFREKQGNFADFLWAFVGGVPRQNRWTTLNQIPAQTRESREMAKALKEHGFSFCGPTVCNAFMQAVGMVNDHLVTCFRHQEVADLSASFRQQQAG